MFCPKCGNSLVEGARFCGECGNPIEATSRKKTLAKQPLPHDETSGTEKYSRDAWKAGHTKQSKKTPIFVVCAGIIVVVLIVAFGIGSCWSQSPSNSFVDPSANSNGATASSSVPSDTTTYLKNDEVRYLVNNELAVSDLDSKYTPIGRLSDDKMMVVWQTSEYDETWKVETNIASHLGVVNSSGELIMDKTDAFQAEVNEVLGSSDATRLWASSENEYYARGYFDRGYGFVGISNGNFSPFLVLDAEGNTLLSSKDFAPGAALANYDLPLVTPTYFFASLTENGNIVLREKAGYGGPQRIGLLDIAHKKILKTALHSMPSYSIFSVTGMTSYSVTDDYLLTGGRVTDWDGYEVFSARDLAGGDYDTVRASGLTDDIDRGGSLSWNGSTIGLTLMKKFESGTRSAVGFYDVASQSWSLGPEVVDVDFDVYCSGMRNGCYARTSKSGFGKLSRSDDKLIFDDLTLFKEDGSIVASDYTYFGHYQGDWWLCCSVYDIGMRVGTRDRLLNYYYYAVNASTSQKVSLGEGTTRGTNDPVPTLGSYNTKKDGDMAIQWMRS